MTPPAPRPGHTKGMERSFAGELSKLKLGDGEIFHGEAIIAITKALLQSGVSYVGGYPGAPVSHLMDVLADARKEILLPMGVHFEQSASEAGAAALMGASIHYPLRGAVTWKSIVGTNVASDGLSNLASAGVVGGALILVGEDYGEGSSIIQERTHATAMKSSIPLIDPRYDMTNMVNLTEHAFELSEACHLPVFMSLRIRSCHMTGSFTCKDNRAPTHSIHKPLPEARFDYAKMVLPPSIYSQEKQKIEDRLPAARRYIVEHGLNEIFAGADTDGDAARTGIILQGGTYGVVMRALSRLGAADVFGTTRIPLLVLNVVHPLVDDQITDFMKDKDSVLVVEEGNPAFIETQVRAMAQKAGLGCTLYGKDLLPEAGEYSAPVVRAGISAYLQATGLPELADVAEIRTAAITDTYTTARAHSPAAGLPMRPPGFCSGCPERPIFTALKLLMRERGRIHVSADIGCSTFASLPPFNMGSTVLGYGMSLASGGAVGPALDNPIVAVMGDGGFWHNGFLTGAVNAQWQGMDAVLVIIENGYASATGQQHVPSTGLTAWGRRQRVSIENTLRGIGVDWIRRVDSYRLNDSMETLRQALDARGPRLRVVISDNECMLAKKRRGNRHKAKAKTRNKPVRLSRYGVDAEVCTGDHACMRLSGCPSLTLGPTRDPLKNGPTARVDDSCNSCNLCGEVAQAAQLCPSFYKAQGTNKASSWNQFKARLSSNIGRLMGAS